MEQIRDLTVSEIVAQLEELDRIKLSLESIDKPSRVTIRDSRKIEEWFNEAGELHRENDLPALIIHNSHGIFRKEWYLNGSLQFNRASVIEYENNGTVSKEFWFNENGCHVIYYYPNGNKFVEYWNNINHDYMSEVYLSRGYHRDNDLPAYIEWDENGVLRKEKWYENDILKAKISYNTKGLKTKHTQYFVNK